MPTYCIDECSVVHPFRNRTVQCRSYAHNFHFKYVLHTQQYVIYQTDMAQKQSIHAHCTVQISHAIWHTYTQIKTGPAHLPSTNFPTPKKIFNNCCY